MITFDPRGTSPLRIRLLRVVLPLLLFVGYLAFRAYPAADGRIPLGEAIVMGVVLMMLALVAVVALSDLFAPARIVRAESPSELELTARLTPIADIEETAAQACAAEIRRLDALLRGDAGVIHGTLPDNQPTEPLLTHEYAPQHHTPPRGFPAIPVNALSAYGEFRLLPEPPPEIYIPGSDTGRHHRDED